jgi:hypothetical protein
MGSTCVVNERGIALLGPSFKFRFNFVRPSLKLKSDYGHKISP